MEAERDIAKNKLPAIVVRALREHRLVGGSIVLLILLLLGILGPVLAPFDPSQMDVANKLAKPFFLPGYDSVHFLGTDFLGRDILSRLFYGARISLLVAAAAVVGAGILGVLAGAVAGYFGRWVDEVLMRLVDIGLSIPFLLLAMTVSLLLGSGLKNVIVVLSISGWMQFARVTRGAVLSVKEREFIEAARAYGASAPRIIARHLIPNLMAPITVIASQMFGLMIYTESSLSFLGFGVPIGVPTWGSMIADGRTYLGNAWWISTIPGIVLTISVLAAFFFGDGMRDLLDPRLKK